MWVIPTLPLIYNKSNMKITNTDNNTLDQIAKELKEGEVICFPTDTVYGFGCDMFNEIAIEKIYKLKDRPVEKALPVLVSNLGKLDELVAEIPNTAKELIGKHWPGALTIVFKKNPKLQGFVTGGKDTIAIRMPDIKLTLDLIELCGGAITSTSANKAGKDALIDSAEIQKQINGDYLLINAGKTGTGKSSTIVDVSGGSVKILRQGDLVIN